MRAAIAAVVFDLDGTLIDSRSDIAAAVNYALTETGRAPLTEEAIGVLVGDGARVLLSRAARLPEDAPELGHLVALYTEHYVAHPAERTRWMPGALAAMDGICSLGLPLALCTNKPRSVTDRVLATLGASARFRAVYGAGDGPEQKPSPGPLLAIASKLEVPAAALVMVGDGPQDILAARAAGSRSVGVVSIFQPESVLRAASPDALIGSLVELVALIESWRST